MVRRRSSAKKKKADELIARYRVSGPKATSSKVCPSAVADFATRQKCSAMVPWTPWNQAWPRNNRCEICWQVAAAGNDRVECHFCNVVVHSSCAELKNKPKVWVCSDCRRVEEIERRERIIETAEHQLKLKRHVNSVAIQARVRSFIRNQPFVKLRKAVVAMQGAVRYLGARRQFRLEHGNEPRPCFFKVSQITGLQRFSSHRYFCLVTIVKNKSGEDDDDDEERTTLYQFQTGPERLSSSTEGSLEFSEKNLFLIPSTVCGVTAYVTLLSKEDAGSRRSSSSSVFYQGQVEWNLEQDLLYFRKARRSLACVTTFGDDRFEPRENPGSTQSFRMMLRADQRAEDEKQPVVKLHLDPCPLASTHYGTLDEMTSVFSRKAVKRRWWALLVDRVLYFYKANTDQTAQFSIQLNSKHQLKYHHHSAILEIKSGLFVVEKNATVILVSHTDTKARVKWFKKLLLQSSSDSSVSRKSTTKHH